MEKKYHNNKVVTCSSKYNTTQPEDTCNKEPEQCRTFLYQHIKHSNKSETYGEENDVQYQFSCRICRPEG